MTFDLHAAIECLRPTPHITQERADWVVWKLDHSNYHPRTDEVAALLVSQDLGAAALTKGQAELIEKIARRAISPVRYGEAKYELREREENGKPR